MVAETGKITEAAKKLYISQPSLTNAIHELEKEMNVVIFNRTNKGISLSAEGEIFLGYARQVLEQAAVLEDKYKGGHGEKKKFCVSTQHYSFAVRDGKLGRGILSNSKTKIVLNMEVSEAERIQEELDLSEAETNSIIHFERGNGLISTNNNNLIVEFKASALEKDLITTDRKDLQELKDRIRKYGTDAYGRK